MRWSTVAAAEAPFAELVGALAEWVARLMRSNAADAPETLDVLLEIENDEVRKRLMGSLIAASAQTMPHAATATLDHIAKTAAGRSDGRARFFLTAWDAVARLTDMAPLSVSLRVRLAFVLFCDLPGVGDPDNPERQRDLSLCYDRVGDVQVAQGDLAGALKSYRDSLAIAERLARSDPGNAGWQRDLSVSYNKVGDVQVAQGDLAGALKSYRDSLAIRERLARSDPGNAGWQRDLSVSYNKVGDVQVAQGDLAGALKSYRDNLVAERLARSDPGNAGWQRDLSVSHAKLASVHRRLGETNAARSELRKGREIIARLVQLAPNFVEWKRDLAWFDSEIARLR